MNQTKMLSWNFLCTRLLPLAAVAGTITIINIAMAENSPGSLDRPAILRAVSPSAPAIIDKISGPYTSSNLSLYLIHGKDSSKFQNFLTLQEGLAKNQVIVKETGDVNELAIQNNSSMAIFVQSGDIVKGGRQDRTMQYDMILPPRSGVVPIKAFCVEHGRWSQRGVENEKSFEASNYQLANKSLKMAAKYSGDQEKVWSMVDSFKSVGYAKASVSTESAMASQSPTSLELALENDKVKHCTEKYVQDLQHVVDKQGDVVGYAFAINGKVNSIDVYANNVLFKKMWPKLVTASATEAFTECEAGKQYAVPKPSAIKECIDDAAKAKAIEQAVSGKSRMVMQETKKNILFETRDANASGAWVHRNYVTKF